MVEMKTYRKEDFPLTKIRRFLEPGPVVLVSSAHKGERNIMTMGWHMMLGFEPALVGCFIWDQNHSFSTDPPEQAVRDQRARRST